MAGAPSAKTPAAERLGSSACTTRMPLSTVSAPAPPAFLTDSRVAPPGPTDVPSTTRTSERESAPPSFSTVSSRRRSAVGDEGTSAGRSRSMPPGNQQNVTRNGIGLQVDDAGIGEGGRAERSAPAPGLRAPCC